ncbi:MAG TPA: hypothetical protein DCQ30_16480 [Acidimicrobiaceae bacterium]|nr:hypothetical protein [Acidimicrobiaceae bacterium]
MTSAVPTTEPIAGRYRLERLLGHGGMADVYRAVDESGGPPVAIKVVRSTDPELARRITREAKAVEGFDHPGLVRLLGSGVHDRHAYMVMELVEGPTLAERLRRGPLAPDRCATLGASLADALAYVHGRGVVHRDVKPANVLLGPGSRVRLADFGIAQVLDASAATVTGTTLGTAAYMAPEQLGHHRVGPEADLWALGAMLLECMTGERAFEGTPAEVVARRLGGAVPSPDGLPAPWRMLLASMMDPDPARRPEAAEVTDMLHAPAFARPWDPRATEAFALSNPAMAAAGGEPAPSADGAPTNVAGPPTLASPQYAPQALRRRSRDRRRTIMLASAVALLVLVMSLGAWALVSRPAPARASHGTNSSTTTTAASVPIASANLVRDVQQAESAGSLSPDVGQQIVSQLAQADAQAQSDPTAAGDTLGAIDQTIIAADSNGGATASVTATLLSDVAAVAQAMGLQNPATTTTTTTPPKPKPGGGGDQGTPTTTGRHH